MAIAVDGRLLPVSIGTIRQVGKMFFPDKYHIGEVEVDSVLEQNHISTAVVTNYATETGAIMSDHINIQPKQLVVQCFMSDIRDLNIVDFGLLNPIAALAGDRPSRTAGAWLQLQSAQAAGDLVDVATNLETYTNMAIIGLTTVQDKKHSSSAIITVTLQEVRQIALGEYRDSPTLIVDNPITETAKTGQVTKDRMAETVNEGRKKTEETKNQSILYKYFEKAFK